MTKRTPPAGCTAAMADRRPWSVGCTQPSPQPTPQPTHCHGLGFLEPSWPSQLGHQPRAGPAHSGWAGTQPGWACAWAVPSHAATRKKKY
ncbi:hypothetical protein TIFTF001_042645 [Ficus carica]|uniref:Uncharacterized protein n=1 Tax=Ficus carica TaxID=3494 RepID=A0AA87ZNR8_FICCA|nr:hypothetical protein TIFTF001_042645 [Ficus carica]